DLAITLLRFLDLWHSRPPWDPPGPRVAERRHMPARFALLLRRRRSRRLDRRPPHSRRLLRALARARVGLGALSTHRQPAAMAQSAVRADVHQALDVHRHLAAQGALDLELALDDAAQPAGVLVAQALHPHRAVHSGLRQDPLRRGAADPVTVGERDVDALLVRQVDAGNACQGKPPLLLLTLLVPRIAR